MASINNNIKFICVESDIITIQNDGSYSLEKHTLVKAIVEPAQSARQSQIIDNVEYEIL